MAQVLRVSEAEVKAVVEPEFTETWHPISHAKVIDAMDAAAENHELSVMKKDYSLSRDGSKMFGTWHIDGGHEDRNWLLGFRQGLSKDMALGVVAGNNIVNCSNMQFNGEYITFRKHSGGLDMSELIWMADKAIEVTMQKSIEFDQWHQSLKEVELFSNQAKCFAFDCMKNGAFPPSKFKAFIDACTEEYQLSKSRSLYTYHGGVTRLHRDSSMFNIADSSRKLIGVCDDYLKPAA